mgnify:FL=1|tara:strand:+ start:10056 stop:12566 length:2511 start_codon:yes stop_codon:yes gene_type:complete
MTEVREPTQEEINMVVNAGDPATPERKAARNKVIEAFKKEYAEKTGVDEKNLINAVAKEFARNLRKAVKMKRLPIEDTIFQPIMNNVPIDEDKVNLTRNELMTRKVPKISFKKVTDNAINTPEYEEKLKKYAGELSHTKGDILLYNFNKMKRKFNRLKHFEETKQELKRIQVDVYKYLGAVSLSEYDTREDVYEFWKEVGEKYKDFKDDLTNFFDAVEKLDSDTKEVKRFKAEIKDIRDEYEEESLQYIVKMQKIYMGVPPAAERYISIIEGIETANRLNALKEEIAEELEGDETPVEIEGKQEAFEAALLQFENWSGEAEAALNDLKSVDEKVEEVADDMPEIEFNSEDVVIDPLLAIEFARNKKLISFTQDGKRKLRTLINKIKKDMNVVLDFRASLNNMLDDIEESLIFDSDDDNYHLPITVTRAKGIDEFIKKDTFIASYNEGEDNEEKISIKVLDTLNELFDKIHKALTNKRWGFAVMTRTAGRSTTFSGGTKVTRKDKGKIAEILRDTSGKKRGGRQNPKGFGARGDIKQEVLDEISGEVVKLLESATAYYLEPLYTGRLPIEIPRYASGRGIKVLASWANQYGAKNVMGEGYNLLASPKGMKIANADDLKNLADFLTLVDSPAMRIEDKTIEAAEAATDALTKIFGKETSEQNANYFSALLYHFMQESEEMELQDEEIENKEIKDRAEEFIKDYNARKPFPIFVLPHFLDQNQGILTKNDAMKQQYNRLKKLYTSGDLEDDLPYVFNKLLKAHDAIRKTLGKEVNYAFVPLTYDGIDSVINKMQIEENIDLSHLEVKNIVKDLDSHSNISKEYGITEEQVYLIKSHFRW